MTTELYILTLAALLQVVQFCLYSVTANLQVGPRTAIGPRDKKIELTGTAGRLQRAMNNHFEGLILFTIAVVVVTLSDQSSPLTRTCAHVYLIARILYVPAYVQGLAPWRSVIWLAGFGSTVLMLIAALV
ncbi:putative MAPEG superfamily protein [Litoreibacter ponti]|uniref:Putative MAPEG superfamily protein n=1 Tax=Litoreibacter ponti TaxID=1510457 RepID=A0A2T6BMA6_9RHOB|nr:MAPEG family protein [Litoreibacter ponti]PTX57182.1 putative MAPEG superfamily protein [Litoreibacter ponti]